MTTQATVCITFEVLFLRRCDEGMRETRFIAKNHYKLSTLKPEHGFSEASERVRTILSQPTFSIICLNFA